MFSVCQARHHCPDGYYERRVWCYIYPSDGAKYDWTGANNYCKGIGAKLIDIETAAELSEVRQFIKSSGKRRSN